jgi:hypothetical protein
VTEHTYGPVDAERLNGRLDDLIRRALRLREHLWIATAAWLVPEPGRVDGYLLDQENLIVAPTIGCYVCEEPWTRREQLRRCTGKAKPGPAPLLPGRPKNDPRAG